MCIDNETTLIDRSLKDYQVHRPSGCLCSAPKINLGAGNFGQEVHLFLYIPA